LLELHRRERVARFDSLGELSAAYRGTALLLGNMIGADDAYTASHSRGVVDMARAVAAAVGLHDEASVRHIEFAALLHDIGKTRIPKSILNKPGSLTKAEWELMRQHPAIGAEMLEGVGGLLAEVALPVRHHHERWDGTGYPDGLSGDAIPIIARVISACDTFDAITTDRPYRSGRSAAEAIEELWRCAGTQLDPAVVAAVVAVVGIDAAHLPGRLEPEASRRKAQQMKIALPPIEG
jgi:putative nucleotidyltransferase with HDIG domain